ncbi:hypothetical protein BUALT_Bualt12G0023100 [Buddleja alternifolia]|uniref:Uncharacterized protein n=1 Tax=Buddleja alternifolia TaxID=168488 RepID=A0AAV6WPB4_9LAMI|nr:hypothetical protein BUALT_Bualt12G0023100 [Buddleja alternifolia]
MDFSSYDNTRANRDVENSKNHKAPSGKVMEIPVTADEIMLAGGLGTTDDISSILPVARDSTDFEAGLLNIRQYEVLDDKTASGQSDPLTGIVEVHKFESKDTEDVHDYEPNDASVNLEASVTSDDVMRAGGFGATDDISSFLPVASDFTDFEANLRGAREYEDLVEEINRPGLGWTNEAK